MKKGRELEGIDKVKEWIQSKKQTGGLVVTIMNRQEDKVRKQGTRG